MLGTSAATQLIDATTKELKGLAIKYSSLAGASFIAGCFDVEKKNLGIHRTPFETFIDWGHGLAYVAGHSKEAQSVFISPSLQYSTASRVTCSGHGSATPPTWREDLTPLLSALPALKECRYLRIR